MIIQRYACRPASLSNNQSSPDTEKSNCRDAAADEGDFAMRGILHRIDVLNKVEEQGSDVPVSDRGISTAPR